MPGLSRADGRVPVAPGGGLFSWLATRTSRSSRQWAATSWTPTGRPPGVQCNGRLTAGWPVNVELRGVGMKLMILAVSSPGPVAAKQPSSGQSVARLPRSLLTCDVAEQVAQSESVLVGVVAPRRAGIVGVTHDVFAHDRPGMAGPVRPVTWSQLADP